MANAGRWADAAATLQAVLAIRSSPKVRFTLGQAQEHVGQLAEAYDTYARVAADATTAGEGDVAGLANGAMHAVEPRVPTLRVVLSGAAAASAVTTVDDHVVQASLPVRVDPGAHKVAVNASGLPPSTTSVTVKEGDHLDVPVHLGPDDPAAVPSASSAPVAPAAPADEGVAKPSGLGPLRITALAIGGAGVVALGIGTYFGLDAISKNNASHTQGCSGNACPQGGYDTREAAKSSASTSTVAIAIGGVLVAGGVALWLLAPHGSASVQIAPAALLGGGGVTVAGAWR
jgi:hypothetical protein